MHILTGFHNNIGKAYGATVNNIQKIVRGGNQENLKTLVSSSGGDAPSNNALGINKLNK